MPLALKSENSFVSASHWLLTQMALSRSRGCGLCPGGGEDRCSRAGPPEGRLSGRPARVCGGVGRPSLRPLACSRPAGAVRPVGADGAGRFAVGGVAVQMWGGSVSFDSLAVGLSRLCGGGTCPCRDAVAADRRTPVEGPLRNELALLLALVRRNYIRKNLITSRDGRI